MKNSTWLRRILTILLTLVVLAGVGFTGYRLGMIQGASLSVDNIAALTAKGRGHFQTPDGMHGHGFDGHNFANRGFDHTRDFGRRGGFSFFSPLFGLIRLAVFVGLIWLAFTFVKRSGWKLVKTETTPQNPTVPVDENSESA